MFINLFKKFPKLIHNIILFPQKIEIRPKTLRTINLYKLWVTKKLNLLTISNLSPLYICYIFPIYTWD
jgi:hypothetical protein